MPTGSMSPWDSWKVPGSSNPPTPQLLLNACERVHAPPARLQAGRSAPCSPTGASRGWLRVSRAHLLVVSPRGRTSPCPFRTMARWHVDTTCVLPNRPRARAPMPVPSSASEHGHGRLLAHTDTVLWPPVRPGPSRGAPTQLQECPLSLLPGHSQEMSLLLDSEELIPRPLTTWIVMGWQ